MVHRIASMGLEFWLVVGVVLAVSALGQRYLGGPRELTFVFGMGAAFVLATVITIAALAQDRNERSQREP